MTAFRACPKPAIIWPGKGYLGPVALKEVLGYYWRSHDLIS
jgi:hypothetical protein